jgi:hypothetical protein
VLADVDVDGADRLSVEATGPATGAKGILTLSEVDEMIYRFIVFFTTFYTT